MIDEQKILGAESTVNQALLMSDDNPQNNFVIKFNKPVE